jgi:C-terminal processing protease CtpA/Prc
MKNDRPRVPCHRSLALYLTLLLFGVTRLAGAEPAAPTDNSNAPEVTGPTSSIIMRKAYLALVKDSIVPASPRVIGNAALEALRSLTPDGARSLPVDFGSNHENDASWLGEAVVDLPSPWSVIEAMGRSAETAHTGLATPERRRGMIAMSQGHPLCSPGFNLYRLGDGRLVVFDVIQGASADTSGLRAGDVLVRCDGRRALRTEPFHLITCPSGTDVVLEIVRGARPQSLVLHLIQAEVSNVESRMLDGGIGYILVRGFSPANDPTLNTANLVCNALGALLQQGARGLVLDLRSSAGGSGEDKIASAFYDGEVVYYLQNPLASPMRPVKRQGRRIWPDYPVVVLVNEKTESAPEALALSMRELGHALILGQPTAGGLTEFSRIPLAEGYAMTIPTGAVRGPITGTTPPSYTVKPDTSIANPSIEDLLAGRDGQLDAARAVIERAMAKN